MSWLIRTLVYATLLTWPGHWIAPAYQSLLIKLTSLVTGTLLAPPAAGSVDLSAANLLTVFVALCLASGFATWPRRLVAIGLGLPLLVAVECATGVMGMNLARGVDATRAAASELHRVLESTLELSRWLAVPLAWGVLLGHRGLRRNPAHPQRATGKS